MARDIYKNPEARNVNQSQGPRVGNQNLELSKRQSFIKEKSSGFREAVADSIMRALEARAPEDKTDPKVEGLHADTGPKSNPTAGGTRYNVKTPAPRKITK